MNRVGMVLYPEKFISKYIIAHSDYESDLKKILEKSGCETDFTNRYKLRLRHLEERKKNCILRNQWFESLRRAVPINAIKFDKNEKNIRILFSFIEYRGIQYAVLLHAFEEKDKKKGSQTSYKTGIPIAQKRLREVMKDD